MRDHVASPLASASPPRVACGARSHTGPAFAAAVARLANGFLAAGLQPGDRVAVLAGPLGDASSLYPNDSVLATLLAATAAGGVTTPLAARASVADLAAWLALVRPGWVCAPRGGLRHAAAAVAAAAGAADTADPPSHGLPLGPDTRTLVLLDVFDGDSDGGEEPPLHLPFLRTSSFPPAPSLPLRHAPSDIAAIAFTSGSSGAPRAALLTHTGLAFQSRVKIDRLGLATPDASTLAPAPLSHVGGLSTALAALAGGGTLVLLEGGWSGRAGVAALARHAVTAASIVPAMAVDIAAEASSSSAAGLTQRAAVASALHRVRAVLIGGGAPPPRAVLRAAFPHAVVHTAYGLTEAGSSVLWGQVGGEGEGAPRPDAAAGAPPAGAPPPGVAAVVAVCAPDSDPNSASAWRLAQPGETGELVVVGRVVMVGFWRARAATAAALLPPSILPTPSTTTTTTWLRTRDAAVADAAGRVWILGRGADALRVGGETVHAARVEAALATVTGVTGVIVVGLPDSRLGSVPAALVALGRGVTWRGPIAPNEPPPPPSAGCGTPLSLGTLRAAARGAGLPGVALPRAAVATWQGVPTRGPLSKPDRGAAAGVVAAALAGPQAKL